MHLDELGYIVQADGDGGDTTQRMGMYWAGLKIQGRPNVAKVTWLFGFINNCYRIFGALVRHPYQHDFRSDPTRMTRDQVDPMIIGMGFGGLDKELRREFFAQVKRFGMYPSGDVPGPTTLAVYIRAMRIGILWPLLFALDIQLLLNAFAVYYRGRDPNYSDDNNHIMRLAQAQHRMPTVTSYLARKLYLLIRPWNMGCEEGGNKKAYKPAIGALRWYHSSQFGGNPELGQMWVEIVNKF